MPLMLTQLDLAIAVFGVIFTIVAWIRVPKSELKYFPFSGLVVLGLLYALVGWAIAIYSGAWWIWVGVFVASVAIALAPSSDLGMTGVRAIGLSGVAAVTAFFTRDQVSQVARWLAIGLAILTAWTWAVGGARQRMENIGLARSLTLWTLITVSWEGLWIGWLVDTFVASRFGAFVVQNLVF